jgi:hypothetical protein
MPAVAGLPAETVTDSYNDLGMLTGTDGMTDYVQNTGYSPYGEIEETRLGTSTGAKQLQILNRYEDGTRRLANTHTVDQTNTGYTSDVDYAYDTSGNVKSVTDNANGKDTQCFAYDATAVCPKPEPRPPMTAPPPARHPRSEARPRTGPAGPTSPAACATPRSSTGSRATRRPPMATPP